MHYTASAVRYPLYDIQCTVSTIRYLMYSIRNKTFPVRHSVCNMQCEVTPLFRVGSLCVFTSWFCRFCWNVILHTFTSWFCRLCSFLKAPFAFSKYLHGKYSAKCCFGDGQVECSSAFKGFVSLSASLKKYFFRGLFQAMCFIQTIHERNPLHSGWV